MREAVKEKEFSKLLKQLKTVDTYLPQLSIEDIQESKIGKLLPNFAKSEKHKDISQAAKKLIENIQKKIDETAEGKGEKKDKEEKSGDTEKDTSKEAEKDSSEKETSEKKKKNLIQNQVWK